MHRPIIYLTVLGLFVFSSLFAVAQVTTGTISGTVKDATGAVVPGAAVTIKDTDTGLTRTLTADSEGRYKATNLNLGNYEVQASTSGFQTEIRKGIELTVGREAAVDFTLTVGNVSEHVDVTAEAPLVDTTSSTVKGLVEDKAILEMPLNGRSFIQLATLQPGVFDVPYAGTSVRGGAGSKISVSGARPEFTSFLLDGLDINDDVNKSPGSVAGVMLGVETIREFSAITNSYTAEFGRAAGGVINAVSKSGTNEFHGSLFEFLRNSALDARNVLDHGSAPAPFKRNQFGGVVGGPIRKDKTFFFFGYEDLRQRLATTGINNVPDANARLGLLPDSTRPGSFINVGVNPKVAPYLNLYPMPNGPSLNDGRAAFITAPSTPTNEDFYQAKIDHTLSSADSLFVRYTIDNATINTPDPYGVVSPLITHSRNQYVTVEEKRIISPTLLNVFRAGFTRTYALQSQAASQPASLSFLPGKPLGELAVTGLGAFLGTSFQSQQLFGMQHYEVADNISRVSGKHSISAGFLGKWYQQFGYSRESVNGYFQFDNLRNLLTEIPTFFRAPLPGSTFERSGRQSLYGLFVQDDYKVASNLTLNLGIRYEFITVPTEKYGRAANVRTLLASAPTVGALFLNPSLKNLSPRFGFAWDVFGNGGTSVRGGFGLFYDQILSNVWRDSLILNPPFFQRGNISPISPSQFPYPDLSTASLSSVEPLAVDYHASQPYVMQYNLTLQKQLPGNTLMSVAYVGNRGIHLGRQGNNVAIPVILDGTKYFPPTATPRNPNFAGIRFKTFDANSNFNSLQVGVTRRLKAGLTYQVSYTFSKFIDDASGLAGAADFNSTSSFTMDTYDIRRDYGLSAYDVRHRLAMNYAYELPIGPGKRLGGGWKGFPGKVIGGWQANGIVSLASGSPISIQMTVNRSHDGAIGSDIADRPNLCPGASNNPVLGSATQYYNPSAFCFPTAGYYGNLGRDTLIGPGRATVDFSLFKNMAIRENKSLQFRAELFNLFNRANFGLPNRNLFIDNSGKPTADAGRITTTVTPSRQLQFGLKFIF